MLETPSIQSFFELNTLEDIFRPVRNAPRVKYTCFDVSENLLILGATSGSLYVFRRDTLAFLRVIPNKEGSVTVISIDGNESYIAFATNRGTVIVLKHNVDESYGMGNKGRMPTHLPKASGSSFNTQNTQHVHLSREHRGANVSTLQWSTSGGCLFIGDNRGTVTGINIAPKKTQTLFLDPSWTVVRLNSKIVQLDFLQDKLLISTLTSCYICDTSKEQYSQIGSKPRDGEFGAYFSRNAASTKQKTPVIYAARPGSRLWEADFEGNVIYTHQLKNAFARPMEPLVSVRQEFHPTSKVRGSPQSLNFTKLISIGENNLLTWAGSHLFIIDTSSMLLTLSTKLSEDILDVRLATSNDVYVQHQNTQLRWLKLLPVEKGLHYLLRDCRWELCGLACMFFDSVVTISQSRAWLPRCALQELEGHLRLQGFQQLANQFGDLMLRLEEPVEGAVSDISPKHYRLESGIYVVNMPNKETIGDWHQLSKRDTQFRLVNDDSHLENASTSIENIVPSKQSGSPTGKSKRTTIEDTTMYASYLGSATWDVDNSFGYLALPSMKTNVSLGEIKSSLSSTYKSGKQRIINTMGILEDHLKAMGMDETAEPLDVQRNQSNTNSMIGFDIDTEQESRLREDSIIFPRKAFYRQNYEEKAFGRQFFAQNIQLNLEPLFHATSEAWDKLQNPQISEDVNRLKDVLEQWLDVLHSTQESWYRAIACLVGSNHLPVPKVHQSKSCNSFLTDAAFNDYSKTLKHKAVLKEQPIDSEMLINKHQQTELKRTGSSKDLTIQSDTETKSTDVCSKNKHEIELQTLSLEDVLWWQDVLSATTHVNMQMPPQPTLIDCWICNAKFIPGNAWKLASSQKETIMQLASICLKTKTFGRITRYCKSIENWTRIDSLDEESSNTEACMMRCQLAVVPKSDVTLDHARSLFVKQYFGLLRPDIVFQEVRLDTQWSCYTWQCVLSEIITTISGISSSNLARGLHYDLRPMNPFLFILRSEIRDSTVIVDKLIEVKDKVHPRDVLYLDQTLEHQKGIFLDYMDRIFGDKFTDADASGSHHAQIVGQCEDHLVEAAWVQLMLEDKPANIMNTKCITCNDPRLFSHLQPWKWQEQLVRKFRSPCVHRTLFLKLCDEHGFWLGKVYLQHKLGLRQEMFKLIVQLGDVGILQDTNNIDLLPQTTEEWSFVFESVIGDREDRSLYCAHCNVNTPGAVGAQDMIGMQQHATLISIEDVALLMVRHCATDVVVSFLLQFIILHPEVQLSVAFYRSYILSAVINQQQTAIMHDILKKTNACIWSKRANYANSQIKELILKKDVSDTSKAIATSGFPDNLQCHWGICLDLASCCHVCSLPLGLLSSSDGVRIYPCGHGYHRRCAITDRCSTCIQSSN